ncbi:carbohydrate esterase family 4 protein, partial [Backusella circina FSU 941]
DEETLESNVENTDPAPIEQQEAKPVELKNKENGIIIPTNPEWLKGINLSKISGKVRPVESGLCTAPKCDGSDNDDCYKNCGCNPIETDVFGCTVKNSWALTFDDGPSNSTLELLDHLKNINVKATFCVIGSYVKQYPQVLKRIYDEGHQIASHTYSHAHLMSLTNEEIIYELKATEEAVREITGVVPKYLRPPFGEADARVKALLKEMGYKLLMWNVDPHDYNHQMKENGGDLIQKGFEEIVMGTGGVNNLNVHKDPGYVSLQHDLYERSIRQVPKAVKLIQDKGFKMMTVSECIGDSQAH